MTQEVESKVECCPFCGSDQTRSVMSRNNGTELWQVICLMCGASGPHSAEEKIAIARWNVIAQVYND